MATRAKTVGLALGPDDVGEAQGVLADLEEWGYATLWLSGGGLATLDPIADIVRSTRTIRVATAVIPVDTFAWQDVARLHAELAAEHPGRLVVGIGGAHGPHPLATLRAFLDRLDEATPPVPRAERLLSALGPRMLELAAERTAGAVPVMITPEHVAWSRDRIGPDPWLVAQQFVVLDAEPDRAREAARGVIGFLRDVEGGYGRHFRRMGFSDDDVATLSDGLVDALVVHGDEDDIRARVAAHHAAGADEVALSVLPAPGAPRLTAWRRVAEATVA